MIYYVSDDFLIYFSMTSFEKYLIVPLTPLLFFTFEQRSEVFFLTMSELNFLRKILSQLGIEQFLKFQVIRDNK